MDKLNNYIMDNNWDKIIILIKKYKNDILQKIFINNRNILHLACINNKYNILLKYKNYIKYFIKGDNDGNTPLHLLLIGGYFNTFKKILPKIKNQSNIFELINNNDETILYLVNKYDNKLFQYLLNKVIDTNIGFNIGSIPLLIYNIKQSQNINDINYNNVELLIKKDADINYPKYMPPLCYSLYEKKPYFLKLLIESKADINVTDKNEMTPLFIATENKDYDSVKLLIHHKANINNINTLTDDNIMKYAIVDKQDEIINMLLNNNFNLHSVDKYLNTSLHLAIINQCNPEIIYRLIYNGDMNKKNLNGETPLHLLVKKYDIDIYDMILENKKLDIFVEDKYNKTPLYYIDKQHINNLMNIVISSYVKQLKEFPNSLSLKFDSCINNLIPVGSATLTNKGSATLTNKGSTTLTNEGSATLTNKGSATLTQDCINIIKAHILSTKRSFPEITDKKILHNKFALIKGDYINNSKFNPNALHNILYTIEFMDKYKNLGIPTQYENTDKFNTDLNKLKLSTIIINNEQNLLVSTLGTYMNFLYEIIPYLIVWKSKSEHYITSKIGMYFKKLLSSEKIRFIIFKLTILYDTSSHANMIIYDKNKMILERFEPYGFINVIDNENLDGFIWNKIGKKIQKYINNTIEYINPPKYTQIASFQLISNDNMTSYKKIGDPAGYCLAWTYWYLEMRINNPDVYPLTLIEKSINDILNISINDNFKKNTIEENNKIFIDFIRNYSDNLDKIKKNVMINKMGINNNNIYNMIYSGEEVNRIYGYFKKQINNFMFNL